jgi:hypothetical protein
MKFWPASVLTRARLHGVTSRTARCSHRCACNRPMCTVKHQRAENAACNWINLIAAETRPHHSTTKPSLHKTSDELSSAPVPPAKVCLSMRDCRAVRMGAAVSTTACAPSCVAEESHRYLLHPLVVSWLPSLQHSCSR